MGKRKRVKANTNTNIQKNGNGETSTSSTKRTREQNKSTDNKIGGGGNSSKKMKRGESSNACVGEVKVEAGAGQSQNQESSMKKTSILDLRPESANANGVSSSCYWTRSRKEAPYPEICEVKLSSKRKIDEDDTSNSPDQDEAADEGPINNLPPENTKMNVNKNENGNGEASASTCSMKMSRGQNRTTDNNNKMEGGENSRKEMKRGESLNSCLEVETGASQRQESRVLDDLPPEMLMQILKCINTRNLFNCRLVNRNWRAISSGILRNRYNSFTDFEYEHGRLVWSNAEFTDYQDTSFRDFVRCINNSKDCPFSHFYFSMSHRDDPLKLFKVNDFKEFISYFASPHQRLKCLELSFHNLNDVETFRMLPQQLSDLLLNKIPRLEELALNFYNSIKAPEVKLFSIDYEENPEINTDQVQFKLPNLKVFRTKSPISSFTEIVRDLLNAAVNLKYLRMQIYNPEDFQFLHSLGKLHLLKEATIEMDTEFLSAIESNKKIARWPLPKLEIVELRMFMRDSGANSWSQAAIFLGNLFESSKDTLTELSTRPFGFFPGLQLPTFTKLRKLEITQYDFFPQPVFPPGIRSRNVFPVVSELDSDIEAWDSAFPQEDFIPVLPRVKFLRMDDTKFKENAISILALMCPKLEKLKIHRNDNHYCDDAPKLNLLNVGRAIWTHMKKLESLEVDVDLDLPENNPFALDSCFTGISVRNCQRLNDLREANKLLGKWGFQFNPPPSVLQSAREYPSILGMKVLKKLTINPYSGKKLLQRMDFFTRLTWISEGFTFKFLPHLKPKPEEEDY